MPIQEFAVDDLAAVARQTKYPVMAFYFTQRALEFSVRRIHGEVPDAGLDDTGFGHDVLEDLPTYEETRPSRHISGQQLCMGIRDYAVQEYGLLARAVLRRWNIRSFEDFGHIVFAMVDAGLMHKTDEDSIEDFRNVIDFAEAFAPQLLLAD